MKRKLVILSLIAFLSLVANAQKAGKKKLKKIYESVIFFYYKGKPAAIIVTDSTSNVYIKETEFGKMAADYSVKNTRNRRYSLNDLDSTWVATLRLAEKEKNNLVSIKIPSFQPTGFNVRLISKDSIGKSLSNGGHNGFVNTFKVSDHVELSSVILIKKRAIVELSRTSGSLSGEGKIFYLRKIKRRWVIVASSQTSVA